VVFRLDLVKHIVTNVSKRKDALEDEKVAKELFDALKKDAEKTPILVMDEPYIKLQHLELEIGGSSLSWLYNAVVSVFNQQVSDALSVALTHTMKKKSGFLLDKLNEMGKHYWPLLLRVVEKNVDKVKKVTDSAKKATRKFRESISESDLKDVSSEFKVRAESILNAKSVKSTRSKISSIAKKVASSDVTKNAIEITKDARRTLGVNIKFEDTMIQDEEEDFSSSNGTKIVTKKKVQRPKRYQVDFMKGTLGFTFRVLGGLAIVQRLVRDQDGASQQAELLGVQPGDVIEKIANTSVEGLNTKRITAMVRCNPRPLCIDFRTFK